MWRKMDVEVDQSIKIEQTSKDTILAFSNDGQVAILIPAKVKRLVLAHLKARGKPAPVARLMLFSAGLCLLLREVAESLMTITIDQEYPGHEADIRGMLLRFLRKIGVEWTKRESSLPEWANTQKLTSERGECIVEKSLLTGP